METRAGDPGAFAHFDLERVDSPAFVVDADTPGLTIAERIDVIAPHPLATLRF